MEGSSRQPAMALIRRRIKISKALVQRGFMCCKAVLDLSEVADTELRLRPAKHHLGNLSEGNRKILLHLYFQLLVCEIPVARLASFTSEGAAGFKKTSRGRAWLLPMIIEAGSPFLRDGRCRDVPLDFRLELSSTEPKLT